MQRELLTQYHVDDPVDVLQRSSDRWQVPTTRPQGAARTRSRRTTCSPSCPARRRPSFQLTSALNVYNRDNLAAYISVDQRSRADYGQIRCCSCPATRRSAGPDRCSSRSAPTPTVEPRPARCSTAAAARRVRQPAHPAGRQRRAALRRAALRRGDRQLLPAAAEGAGRLRRPGRATPTPSPARSTRSSAHGAGASAADSGTTPADDGADERRRRRPTDVESTGRGQRRLDAGVQQAVQTAERRAGRPGSGAEERRLRRHR